MSIFNCIQVFQVYELVSPFLSLSLGSARQGLRSTLRSGLTYARGGRVSTCSQQPSFFFIASTLSPPSNPRNAHICTQMAGQSWRLTNKFALCHGRRSRSKALPTYSTCTFIHTLSSENLTLSNVSMQVQATGSIVFDSP